MKAQHHRGPGSIPAPLRLLTLALTLSLALLLLAACGDGGAPPTSPPANGSSGGTTLPANPPTATLPPAAQPGGAAPTDTAPGPPPAAAEPTETISPDLPPPDEPPPPTSGPVATVSTDEAVVIYSLIAHDLVAQSLTTAASKTTPAYIGISQQAGLGALLDTDSSNVTIPDDVIDEMGDLGTTVTFSPFMDAVGALEDGAKVRDDGIYLTLGVLEDQGTPDKIAAYATYYRANDDATGYRYVLEKAAGGPWVIKDRQPVWDH
jgi:hypothetical protein